MISNSNEQKGSESEPRKFLDPAYIFDRHGQTGICHTSEDGPANQADKNAEDNADG